jgi:hypothetical protein
MDVASRTGKTIVLTNFGSYSMGLWEASDVRYRGIPLVFEPLGFVRPETMNRRLLYRFRLLRESVYDSTVYFCFDGRVNDSGFPKCSIRIKHPDNKGTPRSPFEFEGVEGAGKGQWDSYSLYCYGIPDTDTGGEDWLFEGRETGG